MFLIGFVLLITMIHWTLESAVLYINFCITGNVVLVTLLCFVFWNTQFITITHGSSWHISLIIWKMFEKMSWISDYRMECFLTELKPNHLHNVLRSLQTETFHRFISLYVSRSVGVLTAAVNGFSPCCTCSSTGTEELLAHLLQSSMTDAFKHTDSTPSHV